MAFLFTSVIEVFVPALQDLASTFSRRVRRGLLVEFPSRRSYQVTQADRMAWITVERQKQKTRTLMQVTPAPSRTSDSNTTWTYPVRAPRTRHSCHRGNVTNPRYFFMLIHSIIPYIQTLCMLLLHRNASRCVMKWYSSHSI